MPQKSPSQLWCRAAWVFPWLACRISTGTWLLVIIIIIITLVLISKAPGLYGWDTSPPSWSRNEEAPSPSSCDRHHLNLQFQLIDYPLINDHQPYKDTTRNQIEVKCCCLVCWKLGLKGQNYSTQSNLIQSGLKGHSYHFLHPSHLFNISMYDMYCKHYYKRV